MDLYERVIGKKNMLERAGPIICPNETWKYSFKKLNSLRRGFVHFAPKGWSIEISGTRFIVIDVMSLIQAVRDAGWAFRHLTDSNLAEVVKILQDIGETFGANSSAPYELAVPHESKGSA